MMFYHLYLLLACLSTAVAQDLASTVAKLTDAVGDVTTLSTCRFSNPLLALIVVSLLFVRLCKSYHLITAFFFNSRSRWIW